METKSNMSLIVEGGAMRGIFSAGILDAFIERDFNPFDICIGVSAGANNLTSYLSGMYKRSYKVYTDYNLRKEFISWKKFIKGGHLLDLDWLWDITIREIPIDKDKIFNCRSKFLVGVTEVHSGKIKYFKPNKENFENILKASSSIPIFYRNQIKIDDAYYLDGGIADPIPVKEAVNQGAKTIVVLRSRPYSFNMKNKRNSLLTNILFRKYPELKNSLNRRHATYQDTIAYMRNCKDVNIIEVNPPETFKTERLTKDIDILNKDYQYGYEMGIELHKQLKDLL